MRVGEKRSLRTFVLQMGVGEKLELRKDNNWVKIRPKPLKLLDFLTSKPFEQGMVITKTEIMTLLWPDGGSEGNYNRITKELRDELGADVIKTHPGKGLEVCVPYESTGGDDAMPVGDPLEEFRRHAVHRYHLTLDENGDEVWLYTMLDFRKSHSKRPLETIAPIIVDRAEPDRHPYRWTLDYRTPHLAITTRHLNFEHDFGFELYPEASRRTTLYAVRINETWRKSPGPKTADSIAILRIGKRLDTCKDVDPGPVPKGHWPALEDLWRKGAGSDIIRLPKAGNLEDVSSTLVDHVRRERTVTAEPSLHRFWKKYLDDDLSRKRMLYYGQPLFGRDKNRRRFYRDVEKSKDTDYTGDLVPCHTFLNSGEVKCMLRLLRWFDAQGIHMQEHGRGPEAKIRYISGDEGECHGIVLGVPSVNGLVHGYQNEGDHPFLFKVKSGGIFERDSRGEYTCQTYPNDEKPGVLTTAYALVSRRPGAIRPLDTVVTIISSDIGRAIHGLGDVLTSEKQLAKIQKTLGVSDEWPPMFQLVFKVTLADYETIASNEELVDWWPWPRT